MSENLSRQFFRNLSYAFAAQFTSLCVSIAMSLLVPKMLGIQEFSFWQLFIFYTGYVGLFHFGLSDGVYLRYGGSFRQDLDSSLLGSQLKLMITIHTILCVIIWYYSSIFLGDSARGTVWICTGIYLVLANIFWYLGFLFQATNETSVYSTATIIFRISFLAFMFALLLLRKKTFQPYVFGFLIAQGIGTLYLIVKGRDLFRAPMLPLSVSCKEALSNIKIGLNLTISNIASSLVLGIGRILVDAKQGLESFGLVSLAISLTNFFLMFVSQISMVLFPTLRKLKKENLVRLYSGLSCILSNLLCAILLLYVPVKYLLTLWLPQYAESLEYLGILLPICIFDGKMQLLYNTYLKVLRKEKQLLRMNMETVALSFLLCFIAITLSDSVSAVVFAMVLAIAFRSMRAGRYVKNILDLPADNTTLWEIGISFVYILSNMFCNSGVAFSLCAISNLMYWFVRRKEICHILQAFQTRREG